MIQGFLRDLQPKQARPTLELYFDAKDRSSFPRGDRVPIVLELGGTCLSGTMNSANSNNPPYVHTNLTLGDGTRRSCTEVFLGLGLAEKARLEFELANPNLGMLLLASQIFDEHRDGGSRELILFSDMRQSTSELDLESPSVVPDFVRLQKQGKFVVASLRGVHVYALGVDGAGKSTSSWHSLREFWAEYFRNGGANLKSYSALPESPRMQDLMRELYDLNVPKGWLPVM